MVLDLSVLRQRVCHAHHIAEQPLSQQGGHHLTLTLDPLWEELFPAEQARIIHLLVDRVDIGTGRADVRLRLDGLASLVRDLGTPAIGAERAAA